MIYMIQKGKEVLVDEEMKLILDEYKWFVSEAKQRSKWYVWTVIKGKTTGMHRVIMNIHNELGFEVDHINGNGLDNRKENLRVCTTQQNQFNRKIHKNSTTGFKGVCKDRGKFLAHIGHNGKKHNLGLYETPVEAARAYNMAARLLFGGFANLNKLPKKIKKAV